MARWTRVGPPIAVLTCTVLFSDSIKASFVAVDQAVIQERLERVTRKLVYRKAVLESMFHEVGCDAERLTEQPVPGSRAPNLICTLTGQTNSEIVVGGHFDSIEDGMGAVDDWSGAALLPSLYESLKSAPRRHSFVFAGFAGEERGLAGSREFVRRLAKEDKGRIHAMINLECLGVGPPEVWASRANPRLLDAYLKVAGTLAVQKLGENVDNVGDDDSHPFLDARIPVLTIHSLTSDTLHLIHTRRDNLAAIHPGDYYTAYRLAAAYLAYLDTALE